MAELIVTIPGKIERRLSPNASRHMHWATKKKARDDAQEAAALYARQSAYEHDVTGISAATYHIELGKAKGEKQKDADNLVASCKAYLDGIAAALGVDDRGWTLGTVTQVRDSEGTGYLSIRLEWEQAEGAAA